MFTEIKYIDLDTIEIFQSDRQRSKLDKEKVEELAASIYELCLFHPILITLEGKLIAGSHRLAAFKHLKESNKPCPWPEFSEWNLISVRVITDKNTEIYEAIELEENVKRSPMFWQDETNAINRYHEMQKKNNPAWTQEQSAEKLSICRTSIYRHLRVAAELHKRNVRVLKASGISAAFSIISREQDRAIASELENIGKNITPIKKTTTVKTRIDNNLSDEAEAKIIIQNGNFLDHIGPDSSPWKTKFNFIHCDFPYGINHQKSSQGGANSLGSYKDTPETFWHLVNMFFTYLDQFMHPNGYIMFWYAMKNHNDLIEKIDKLRPELITDPYPLIWSKSDGKGITPDHLHGPRRTYETALLIRRGDKAIVKPVANSISSPTGTKEHQSVKPEPMLRHFFRMFVDEYTSILDPTCGSGTAIRAADFLGARTLLGYELDPEYSEHAQVAFRKARRLRELSLRTKEEREAKE